MSVKSTNEEQARFASQDPPFLSSAVPSSTGPITPPPLIQDILEPPPYHSTPPPYPGKVKVQPHHYLEPHAVNWDIVDHPSLISRNHHSISSRVLDEPAFDMPLRYILITNPYLPWTIIVRPSNNSYITLKDVYDSIYRSLRTNITQNEFSAFKFESDRRRATRAYEERYRRQRSARAYEEEKRAGMKRIDFLMGRTRFLGIVNFDPCSDEWQLNLA